MNDVLLSAGVFNNYTLDKMLGNMFKLFFCSNNLINQEDLSNQESNHLNLQKMFFLGASWGQWKQSVNIDYHLLI